MTKNLYLSMIILAAFVSAVGVLDPWVAVGQVSATVENGAQALADKVTAGASSVQGYTDKLQRNDGMAGTTARTISQIESGKHDASGMRDTYSLLQEFDSEVRAVQGPAVYQLKKATDLAKRFLKLPLSTATKNRLKQAVASANSAKSAWILFAEKNLPIPELPDEGKLKIPRVKGARSPYSITYVQGAKSLAAPPAGGTEGESSAIVISITNNTKDVSFSGNYTLRIDSLKGATVLTGRATLPWQVDPGKSDTLTFGVKWAGPGSWSANGNESGVKVRPFRR